MTALNLHSLLLPSDLESGLCFLASRFAPSCAGRSWRISLHEDVPSLPLALRGGPEWAGLEDQEPVLCAILVFHEPVSTGKDASSGATVPISLLNIDRGFSPPQVYGNQVLHRCLPPKPFISFGKRFPAQHWK